MVLGRGEDLAVRDLTKWLYHLLQFLRRERGGREREREREEGREAEREKEKERKKERKRERREGGRKKETEIASVLYKIFKMKITNSVCVCTCACMCESW